jgi:hypothetical protein
LVQEEFLAGEFGDGMEDAVVGRLCTISDFAWLYGHILGLSFGHWLGGFFRLWGFWLFFLRGSYIESFVWFCIGFGSFFWGFAFWGKAGFFTVVLVGSGVMGLESWGIFFVAWDTSRYISFFGCYIY